MKKILLAMITMTSLNSFASMAINYTCEGTDVLSKKAISFKVDYTDFDRDIGQYTNQAIIIDKVDGKEQEKSVSYQQFGATRKNNCLATPFGEIFLLKKIKTFPSEKGLNVAFSINCPETKMKVQGHCTQIQE